MVLGIKFGILAVMGLGALYMLHLLAQDFIKIRRNIQAAKTLLRLKRDERIFISNKEFENLDSEIDWKKIMNYDPFDCLPSFMCQLAAGAELQNNKLDYFRKYVKFVVDLSGTPSKIKNSYVKGSNLKGKANKCLKEYPFCVYTAKTMLQIMDWLA